MIRVYLIGPAYHEVRAMLGSHVLRTWCGEDVHYQPGQVVDFDRALLPDTSSITFCYACSVRRGKQQGETSEGPPP
jgi:hypothetical protein